MTPDARVIFVCTKLLVLQSSGSPKKRNSANTFDTRTKSVIDIAISTYERVKTCPVAIIKVFITTLVYGTRTNFE